MGSLTIGQLAKQAGVNVETVRYYERRHLIPEPPRNGSGYRQYSEDFVLRIRFVKRAQELGFSLNEIKDLLALRVESETVCDDVRKQATLKIVAIKAKMQLLQKMQQTLAGLVRACEANELTGECPILKTLDEDNPPASVVS